MRPIAMPMPEIFDDARQMNVRNSNRQFLLELSFQDIFRRLANFDVSTGQPIFARVKDMVK